jgi:hypothetical protein
MSPPTQVPVFRALIHDIPGTLVLRCRRLDTGRPVVEKRLNPETLSPATEHFLRRKYELLAPFSLPCMFRAVQLPRMSLGKRSVWMAAYRSNVAMEEWGVCPCRTGGSAFLAGHTTDNSPHSRHNGLLSLTILEAPRPVR